MLQNPAKGRVRQNGDESQLDRFVRSTEFHALAAGRLVSSRFNAGSLYLNTFVKVN